MPLHTESCVTLAGLVQRGELSAVEVTRYFLDRATRANPALGAFLYIDAEGALAQAATLDAQRASGVALGALAGVPVALKDNLCTRGVPTTCASRILEGYVPPYDAHVVEALRSAGAVVIGKTNMDEFAMGSSNENSAYFPARNPWNTAYVPGGSSGGAASATASSLVMGALGSDTGGSVRQPGAFCGVVALKPTYGRVSRYGLIAFASSLDQIGPFARNTRDAARFLGVISGHDARDATSATREVEDYESACGEDLRGLRIGLVQESVAQGCDSQVAKGLLEAIEILKRKGCTITDVSLPHAKYAVAVYYLVATAEASSNLARFDGMRYGLRVNAEDLPSTYENSRGQGFGPEVKRRIMLGTYALSAGYYDAFYLKAQKIRTLIRQDYHHAFEQCDLVLTPTSPAPAFRFNERVDDPLAMYLEDIFTLPPSLAGLAAMNVPCGFTREGMPLGMQLCGPAFSERTILRAAHAYEQEAGWHLQHPKELI
ncbi:MAG: Asp-tRNA(Asn)/Glu-tRNA(Gln) amidotransferase subunit GatA [Myxococcales bacterium]|nr:Asp-tRNA(Asn)/Glu-tRNA(Gln) amidotransferase subunit GatA [Myxococcales bacterium]MCB9708005.1 Asp-tRNA(Asn)/Glu-tRNA(Gln) amidotransferase subunit GatA [Myxococcales bacterium]